MITVLKPYFLPKRRHSTKSYFIKAIDGASDISRKKSKILRDFQGQIRGKIGRFRGIFTGKSQNSWNDRPISGDFRGRKVKIRRKIGPFRGILAEKSQFSKDFQGQIIS